MSSDSAREAFFSKLASDTQAVKTRALANAVALFEISRTVEISKAAVASSRELLIHVDSVLWRGGKPKTFELRHDDDVGAPRSRS